jgi:hypothetical protein
MRTLYIAILGAVALGAAITGPQAASIGTAKIWRAADGSLTEKIAYRKCWWRQGVRYCRRYRASYAPYNGAYRYGYSGSSVGIILGIQ